MYYLHNNKYYNILNIKLKMQNNQDFYEGSDEDVDIDALNRANIYEERGNASNPKEVIDTRDGNVQNSYNLFHEEIDKVKLTKNDFVVNEEDEEDQTAITSQTKDYENPLSKFMKIKKEIDLIEKDMQFYQKNKDAFKSDVSIEDTMTELKKLKEFANFIYTSPDFAKLKKIVETQEKNKLKVPKNKIQVLNKEIYSKLNSHLLNRMKLINQLKADNPKNIEDIEFELYVAPDTNKVKQIKNLIELKKSIQALESKIGEYENKKVPITTLVMNIKSYLKIFEPKFIKSVDEKMKELKTKLQTLKMDKSKEDYTSDTFGKMLKDFNFNSAKECEDLIFDTISKMETLKNYHEESAFISLKIKELINQQDKISSNIDETNEILENLNKNIKENITAMKKNIQIIKEKLKK